MKQPTHRELKAAHDSRLRELTAELERLKEVELNRPLRKLQAEVARLTTLVNTPLTDDFSKAVEREAKHQMERWGTTHDADKEPEDWFWTLGYLATKAVQAHRAGDLSKALHHTISSAALLSHWHRRIMESSKESQ